MDETPRCGRCNRVANPAHPQPDMGADYVLCQECDEKRKNEPGSGGSLRKASWPLPKSADGILYGD